MSIHLVLIPKLFETVQKCGCQKGKECKLILCVWCSFREILETFYIISPWEEEGGWGVGEEPEIIYMWSKVSKILSIIIHRDPLSMQHNKYLMSLLFQLSSVTCIFDKLFFNVLMWSLWIISYPVQLPVTQASNLWKTFTNSLHIH